MNVKNDRKGWIFWKIWRPCFTQRFGILWKTSKTLLWVWEKTAKTPWWDKANTKLWLDFYSPCLKTPLTTFCLTTLMNFNHYWFLTPIRVVLLYIRRGRLLVSLHSTVAIYNPEHNSGYSLGLLFQVRRMEVSGTVDTLILTAVCVIANTLDLLCTLEKTICTFEQAGGVL